MNPQFVEKKVLVLSEDPDIRKNQMKALFAEMARERFARRTGKALVPSNASMNIIPPFNRFVSGANSADDIVRFSSPVADTEGVVNSDNSGMSLPALADLDIDAITALRAHDLSNRKRKIDEMKDEIKAMKLTLREEVIEFNRLAAEYEEKRKDPTSYVAEDPIRPVLSQAEEVAALQAKLVAMQQELELAKQVSSSIPANALPASATAPPPETSSSSLSSSLGQKSTLSGSQKKKSSRGIDTMFTRIAPKVTAPLLTAEEQEKLETEWTRIKVAKEEFKVESDNLIAEYLSMWKLQPKTRTGVYGRKSRDDK
jgi:hypothetical protein